MEVYIQSAILHVLDTNISLPVFSDTNIELRGGLEEYLSGHILKCMEDDNTKKCEFSSQAGFPQLLPEIQDHFDQASRRIAEEIFRIMVQNPAIPRADLLCALFTSNGTNHLAVLKMNYREGYCHYLEQAPETNSITLITQQTLLPPSGSKVDEAFIVNLSTKEVWVTEKKYEIDGVKGFYLSNLILNCEDSTSPRQKINAVKKYTQRINKEFFNGDKQKEQEVATVLHAQLSSGEEISVDNLCQELYKNHPTAASTLSTNLQEADIRLDETIKASPSTVKRLGKQSIKTNNGIEIKIPVELCQNDDWVEFINNPDGTISLLVKDIQV